MSFKEAFISTTLVISSLFLLEPMELLMPKSVGMYLPLAIIIVFFVLSIFLWKEKGEDEREDAHIQTAGRLSFFAGSAVIVAGIVAQASTHEVDPWLIYALSVMVFIKLLSRFYSRLRK